MHAIREALADSAFLRAPKFCDPFACGPVR